MRKEIEKVLDNNIDYYGTSKETLLNELCVLFGVMCSLCESIKDCGDIINKPIECGQCGNVHKN